VIRAYARTSNLTAQRRFRDIIYASSLSYALKLASHKGFKSKEEIYFIRRYLVSLALSYSSLLIRGGVELVGCAAYIYVQLLYN